MKPNPHFQVLHGDGLFLLTPALPLGEREKRSQLLGEATAGFCRALTSFAKTSNGCPLSPRERVRVRGRRAQLRQADLFEGNFENTSKKLNKHSHETKNIISH